MSSCLQQCKNYKKKSSVLFQSYDVKCTATFISFHISGLYRLLVCKDTLRACPHQHECIYYIQSCYSVLQSRRGSVHTSSACCKVSACYTKLHRANLLHATFIIKSHAAVWTNPYTKIRRARCVYKIPSACINISALQSGALYRTLTERKNAPVYTYVR